MGARPHTPLLSYNNGIVWEESACGWQGMGKHVPPDKPVGIIACKAGSSLPPYHSGTIPLYHKKGDAGRHENPPCTAFYDWKHCQRPVCKKTHTLSCAEHIRMKEMQNLSFPHAPLYPNDKTAESVSSAREAANQPFRGHMFAHTLPTARNLSLHCPIYPLK